MLGQRTLSQELFMAIFYSLNNFHDKFNVVLSSNNTKIIVNVDADSIITNLSANQ